MHLFSGAAAACVSTHIDQSALPPNPVYVMHKTHVATWQQKAVLCEKFSNQFHAGSGGSDSESEQSKYNFGISRVDQALLL